jgi:hypothetical protein
MLPDALNSQPLRATELHGASWMTLGGRRHLQLASGDLLTASWNLRTFGDASTGEQAVVKNGRRY